MRRLTAILISCLLATLATGPVAAQEDPSSPPWWYGERVEMDEHGFALTIPGGWMAFDVNGDLDEQVRDAAAVLELPDEAAQRLVGALVDARERGTLIVVTTDVANCEVFVPGDAEGFAQAMYEAGLGSEQVLDIDPPRSLALPSGPAVHMAWTSDDANAESAIYAAQDDDLSYAIQCSSGTRPQDDWLSVAESFEWLAGTVSADASPTPRRPPATSPAPTPEALPSAVPPGPPYPDQVEGTAVYDQAAVIGPFAEGVTEQTIKEIWEASGAEVVVYTQVKPESDTFAEAEADAAALMEQWGLGRDSLVLLFDLDPGLCYSQVQLYASAGYANRHLSNPQRQALFEEEMLPPLDECDFDTALLNAIIRIRDAAGAG